MDNHTHSLTKNLGTLNERIEAACKQSDRPREAVKLMAVTKRFPLEIAASAVQAGLSLLGENRIQEAVEKIQKATFDARWELIGHLQSNKAQLAVQHFDAIQSVDSLKLARRLNRFSEEIGKELPILLQVNTGEDPGKFGFNTAETEGALEQILDLEALKVEGLMTIAPLPATLESAKAAFESLRKLRDQLTENTGNPLPELSMGMSGDLEAAIAEGSTCIRVGSALFGQRPV
jgi:PLP dependent protein